MSPIYLLGGCLWGWVCDCMFSVGRVCVHVGLCFCVYSSICLHVCMRVFDLRELVREFGLYVL
jgi:hypothetical protein